MLYNYILNAALFSINMAISLSMLFWLFYMDGDHFAGENVCQIIIWLFIYIFYLITFCYSFYRIIFYFRQIVISIIKYSKNL